MDGIIKYIFKFLIEFIFGKESKNEKTNSGYWDAPSTQKTVHQPEPYVPPKKYRDSRWEGLDELFWNMMREEVILRKKKKWMFIE
ncbi:Uncharacterised protein [Klebsiella pneumoniae]|uniref:hypothetical protein n=1 Tax=Klebsiella pneumoniae TaxID=573 RepID=UPI000DE5F9E7|nr:hypothetical protein [Klebsiella pneumoniae]QGA59873.1 hypothetical protein GHA50_05540 [Klebsiella pneumoniae]SSK55890.1 Uncharacterised protein [Klebsiella pneumoniae]